MSRYTVINIRYFIDIKISLIDTPNGQPISPSLGILENIKFGMELLAKNLRVNVTLVVVDAISKYAVFSHPMMVKYDEPLAGIQEFTYVEKLLFLTVVFKLLLSIKTLDVGVFGCVLPFDSCRVVRLAVMDEVTVAVVFVL